MKINGWNVESITFNDEDRNIETVLAFLSTKQGKSHHFGILFPKEDYLNEDVFISVNRTADKKKIEVNLPYYGIDLTPVSSLSDDGVAAIINEAVLRGVPIKTVYWMKIAILRFAISNKI